ncbi:MAG: hypothetical protein LBQ42_05290 [Synergistaceae bacterium]|jgi:hypothetical protein|nr:hypothetical protein [Synergistaceae bacterium]
MSISYFVFTSGERGVAGEDWGVKFVSREPDQKEWLKWDNEYRETTGSFSLSPNLLDSKSISLVGNGALVLLPWSGSRVLLGFIFPYQDKLRRLNISLVAALVPDNLCRKHNPAEVAKKLWAQNSIEDIAKRKEDRKTLDTRPDSLELDLTVKNDASVLMPKFWGEDSFNKLVWPGKNTAAFFVDGRIQECLKEPSLSEPSPRLGGVFKKQKRISKLLVAAIAVAILAAIVFLFAGDRSQGRLSGGNGSSGADAKREEAARNMINKIKEKNNGTLDGLLTFYLVKPIDADLKFQSLEQIYREDSNDEINFEIDDEIKLVLDGIYIDADKFKKNVEAFFNDSTGEFHQPGGGYDFSFQFKDGNAIKTSMDAFKDKLEKYFQASTEGKTRNTTIDENRLLEDLSPSYKEGSYLAFFKTPLEKCYKVVVYDHTEVDSKPTRLYIRNRVDLRRLWTSPVLLSRDQTGFYQAGLYQGKTGNRWDFHLANAVLSDDKKDYIQALAKELLDAFTEKGGQ